MTKLPGEGNAVWTITSPVERKQPSFVQEMMASDNHLRPVVVNIAFALGLLLLVTLDVILDALTSGDPEHPMRFRMSVAGTVVDAVLFISVFVVLRTEIRKRRIANERLVAATRIKSEFLQLAAHDLRNPLNNLLLLSSLIPPEASETAQAIRSSVREMLGSIDSLLDTAALESGTLKLHRTTGDLVGNVREMVERNRPQAESKNLRLLFSGPQSCMAELDWTRIRQAVDNLVSNAVKFSPPEKSITVTVERDQNMATIEVADEGPGLTDCDRKNLFERFQRLSARPTGGEKSTGLGLANAKLLVELHGGRIGAESAGSGQGSRFWIKLPLQPTRTN